MTTIPFARPATRRRIPLFQPTVPAAAVDRVTEVLQSSWLGLGPVTEEFEAAFGTRVGADHVLAVNSGTAALQLALKIIGVGPGDDVVLPANTFVSTGHTVLYEGAHPVFADIDATTGNVDPVHLRSVLTPHTAAIMVVHFAGMPCDLDAVYEVARDAGVPVVEDCAHACGARYRGRPIGGGPSYQAFSFHATKNLAVGEGGALVVPDAAARHRGGLLRRFGIDKPSPPAGAPASMRWDYAVDEVGLKCNMGDVQAAIGLAQLDELDAINEHRAALVRRYTERIRAIGGARTLYHPFGMTSGNFIMPVLVDHRDAVMDDLDRHGVETGVHFRRIDSHPMYTRADLPATEWFWRHVLSLPLHAGLDTDDVDAVCDAVARATARAAGREPGAAAVAG